MTTIFPFRGIRYNVSNSGPLDGVIAPPYDVISPEGRRLLAERSEYNVIRLILSEEKPGDGRRENKYTRAAGLWNAWREREILKRDDKPCIYRYNVSFDLKTPEGLATLARPGFVAMLKLSDYSEGKVLPHERTLAGPKQDRFQLMLHTRAHFSQVFMLYPDKDGKLDEVLGSSPPSGSEVMSVEDDLGVTHSMWAIGDEEAIARVDAHIGSRPVYIADGHHRYETSLTLRRHQLDHAPLFAEGTDRVMAYFTPAEHPGLVVFPYHRLIHNLPQRRLSGLLKKLSDYFIVDQALLNPLDPGEARRDYARELRSRGESGPVFGMVERKSGNAYYLTLKSDSELAKGATSEIDHVLRSLDVVILEDLILTGMLDIKQKDLLNERYINYETDYDRILDEVQKKPNEICFLMNPTPVKAVLNVADLKGIMPEKSTYFFPKLATGLVMNSMSD